MSSGPQETQREMSVEIHPDTDIAQLFQKNRFEQIEAALKDGNLPAVRRLAMAVRAEYVDVHDGFRDAVALTLAYVANNFGSDVADRIGQLDVQKRLSGGELPPYGQQDIRQKIRGIAAGWHWHATRFSLSEDEEKVTFLLHPCGSGMRLITEGNYLRGPWGPPEAGSSNPRLTRSKAASWSTFMNEQFPVYCNHCSEISHVGLANGNATFLVEGWTPARKRGLCVQHSFKHAALVPDEFYRRADLPVPTQRLPVKAGRLFSQEELIDIETHPLDKLIARAERGDVTGARPMLDECLIGWRDCIHDAYRRWLSSLWLHIHQILGPKSHEEVIRETAPALLAHARGADALGWASFWSIHLGLVSISRNKSGYEFFVRSETLLEPGDLPCEPRWFVERLNEGLEKRQWTDVGQIRYRNELLVHTGIRLPLDIARSS